VFLSILSVRCTLTEKGFTFWKGETFKPRSEKVSPFAKVKPLNHLPQRQRREILIAILCIWFFIGAAHRDINKAGFQYSGALHLWFGWVAVFLSILSVRCTLTEKGFTFYKGETFKPRSKRFHLL
jgi:hypothetical protein